jgi:hypothetical protein
MASRPAKLERDFINLEKEIVRKVRRILNQRSTNTGKEIVAFGRILIYFSGVRKNRPPGFPSKLG